MTSGTKADATYNKANNTTDKIALAHADFNLY
jgi:hypothetical protein